MLDKIVRICFISFAILCVAYYSYLFFLYTLNIPFWDDFFALDFVNKFVSAPDLLNKISLLLYQEVEHRLVFKKILYILSFWIFGEVNFKYLCYAGNIFLVGIVAILFIKFIKNNPNVLLFVPVIFIFFCGQLYAISFWTEASIVYYSSNFFIIAALYFIVKKSVKFYILSIFLAVLAVISYGNGFVVFIVGSLILCYQKRYKQLGIFAAVFIFVLLAYFFDYKTPESSKSIIEGFNLFNFIKTLLSFIGGVFPLYGLSIIFGAIGLLFIFYLTYIKYYERNLFIYSIVIYLLITGAILAINRPVGNIMRYKFYNSLFLALFYMILIEICSKKYLKLVLYASLFVFLGYMIFFNILLFFEIRKINENQLITVTNFTNDKPSLWNSEYDNAYTIALEKGIYIPPVISKDNLFSKIEDVNLIKETNNIDYKIDTIGFENNILFVRGTAYVRLNRKKYNNNVYLVLISSKHDYVYKAKIEFRPSLLKTISDMTPMYSGFNIWINTEGLPKDNYKLGLYLNQKYSNVLFQNVLSKIDNTALIENYSITDHVINL